MSYSRDPNIPGLTHHTTAYKPSPTRLQTLDIWLPSQQISSTPGVWIIYVHGGAWRDPTQDSLCAVPTLRALADKHADLFQRSGERRIAGIASLNYRLSPYPNHPTDPSAPEDEDRNVTHPRHVEDVRDAITYLLGEYKVECWIGVGHSCGATLLLQLPLICTEEDTKIRETQWGMVLLAGIYDIPTFLAEHTPPHCPENIARIYVDIVAGALGEDDSVYRKLSPFWVPKGALWGRRVVLGHSKEDELVEPKQGDVMFRRYNADGWVRDPFDGVAKGEKVIDVRELTMGHDEVWENGVQVADLIAEVVAKVDL
ncbi:hypothetical protein PMIN06_005921 [Paraphaeosphaeria minitans]|uniref:Kynurenine formamidase n=1 Tax=Paraphaeosphaeria minitans TaxID=565426 RepID=A0A9P6GTP2_9PLEO|nr:Kynurenine formamidase 2 [Paraphaeosphaeria minitans]